MDLSIFLGRVLGLYLIIMGIFYIVRKDLLLDMVDELFRNYTLNILGGVFGIIIGLMLVVGHNVWTKDWRVLITLIGYLSLLKGLCRLYFPLSGEEFSKKMVSRPWAIFWGIFCLVLGGFLAGRSFLLH